MNQLRTLQLGIIVALSLCFASLPVPSAQEVDCDNSEAEAGPVIPTNDTGEPLSPEEIQSDENIARALLGRRVQVAVIKRCLEKGEALINHVIDFSDYVDAWKVGTEGTDRAEPPLRIERSVLWSFREEGPAVSLEPFVKDGSVTSMIQWKNVTTSLSASARNVVFQKQIMLTGVTFQNTAVFHGATFQDVAVFSGATFEAGADFHDAAFRGAAIFSGVTFEGGAYFHGVEFHKVTSFSDATFLDEAYFHSETEFHKNAIFSGVTFEGSAYFHAGTTFQGRALFADAVFKAAANFHAGTTFHASADFRTATFSAEAYFDSGTEFYGPALFGGATFGARTDPNVETQGGRIFASGTFQNTTSFREAIFNVDADFAGFTFPQETIFQATQFKRTASFEGAIFDKDVNFTDAIFGDAITGKDVKCKDATSGEEARFQTAKFKGAASFVGATFCNDAMFRAAFFGEDLYFRDAKVKGTLTFDDATWEGSADLRNSTVGNLAWESENRPSIVKGVFDAREATLKGIMIKEIYFSDLADFSDANIGEGKNKVIFESVIFEKTADFLRADFRGDAIFVRNRFRGLWDFTGAMFPEDPDKQTHLCLSFNRIGKLVMEREHLYGGGLVLYPLQESRIRRVEDNGGTDQNTLEGHEKYRCADLSSLDQHELQQTDRNQQLSKIYKTIESSFRETNDRQGENEAWYLGRVAERKNKKSLGTVRAPVFLRWPFPLWNRLRAGHLNIGRLRAFFLVRLLAPFPQKTPRAGQNHNSLPSKTAACSSFPSIRAVFLQRA